MKDDSTYKKIDTDTYIDRICRGMKKARNEGNLKVSIRLYTCYFATKTHKINFTELVTRCIDNPSFYMGYYSNGVIIELIKLNDILLKASSNIDYDMLFRVADDFFNIIANRGRDET